MASTYDINDYDLIVAKNRISGFGEGSAIEIEYDTEAFTDRVGVDGEVVRSRQHDRRATATVTLVQSSASNEFLDVLLQNSRISGNGAGIFSFSLRHRTSGESHMSAQAWIMSEPSHTIAGESADVEWQIRLAVSTSQRKGLIPNA